MTTAITQNKQDLVLRMKEFLFRRQRNYLSLFDPTNEKNVAAQEVLKDLAKFCRAHESTFHPDARVHATLEGRREVWLRISQHLKLDSQTLWKLYGKGTD